MKRREFLKQLGCIGLSGMSGSNIPLSFQQLMTRTIPATGELLPCVGLGTWQTFDVGESEGERKPLKEVLKTLVAKGGKIIDSSPMYGRSETVVGDLSQSEKLIDKLFMATKVWTTGLEAGRKQIEQSFSLLKRKKIDLLQIHNLLDWKIHLKTLRQLKEDGKIRYIGLTHYLDNTHETIENIISKNEIDFIQINYSLGSRHAEERLLPAAADRGVAVIINRPFQEGALFDLVKGKTVPPWASEFDCNSWGQFFLKFILSNANVTCAIPGTSKVNHLVDNLGAGYGKLPDNSQRKKMIAVLDI